MSYAVSSFDHRLVTGENSTSENTYVFWALVLSLAIHITVLTVLHPIAFSEDKTEHVLDIELAPPPKPLPPPPPEPPKPPPPKPIAQPPVKMLPAPVVRKEIPTEPPPRVEPPPSVITAQPKTAEPPPTLTAPPPPPEPPKPNIAPDTEAARGAYANLLGREFAKHKQYPRLAQMRGWQGTVTVQLQMDPSGTVTSSSISQSSGFEVLDKQALEMVKKASPLPQPPEALRDHEFTIHVPVVFRLE